MTDLYGVRVLDLDPDARRVRLRVVVVYYDFDMAHGPVHGVKAWALPRNASFFLRALWDGLDTTWGGAGGPPHNVIDVDEYCSEVWIDEHCSEFIDRVRRVEVRNDPPRAWLWPEMDNGSSGGRDGSVHWRHEDRMSQADYDVWVTDRRCLEGLWVDRVWETTAYDTRAGGYETSLWSTHRNPRM